MLFNSLEFVFVFFPAALVLFLLLGRASRDSALSWLVLASLGFYAWWRPFNILIIAPFVLIHFVLARVLLRLAADDARAALSKGLLALGIVFNLSVLGYFKYADSVAASLNEYAGTTFVLSQVVMPLAISFISFQLIAFLIDVQSRRIDSFTLWEFVLFVLFFPQLIAGPIVHFREMMPQFRRVACRFDHEGVSVGLTLFALGLFKKVVLADGLALYVTPIYEHVADGGSALFIEAWIAAVGFTLQIYFDFSGYSDMAVGLACCFGIRLPINFDSPLKSSNIIDFWQRWHSTLTRFLTAYLYNPLAIHLTRRRMAKGLPGFGERHASAGAYLQLVIGPTILTMLVSGLWHGVGLTFILWGLLHGIYISINHGWRLVGPRFWPDKASYENLMVPAGLVITFVSVTVSMVLFRAPTVGTALEVLRGMSGVNGISLPPNLLEQLNLQGSIVSASYIESGKEFVLANAWVGVSLFIVLALPNTLQFTAAYEPVLGATRLPAVQGKLARLLVWRPSIFWAVAVSALAAAAIMRIGGKSEFLYWQF